MSPYTQNTTNLTYSTNSCNVHITSQSYTNTKTAHSRRLSTKSFVVKTTPLNLPIPVLKPAYKLKKLTGHVVEHYKQLISDIKQIVSLHLNSATITFRTYSNKPESYQTVWPQTKTIHNNQNQTNASKYPRATIQEVNTYKHIAKHSPFTSYKPTIYKHNAYKSDWP